MGSFKDFQSRIDPQWSSNLSHLRPVLPYEELEEAFLGPVKLDRSAPDPLWHQPQLTKGVLRCHSTYKYRLWWGVWNDGSGMEKNIELHISMILAQEQVHSCDRAVGGASISEICLAESGDVVVYFSRSRQYSLGDGHPSLI